MQALFFLDLFSRLGQSLVGAPPTLVVPRAFVIDQSLWIHNTWVHLFVRVPIFDRSWSRILEKLIIVLASKILATFSHSHILFFYVPYLVWGSYSQAFTLISSFNPCIKISIK